MVSQKIRSLAWLMQLIHMVSKILIHFNQTILKWHMPCCYQMYSRAAYQICLALQCNTSSWKVGFIHTLYFPRYIVTIYDSTKCHSNTWLRPWLMTLYTYHEPTYIYFLTNSQNIMWGIQKPTFWWCFDSHCNWRQSDTQCLRHFYRRCQVSSSTNGVDGPGLASLWHRPLSMGASIKLSG